MIINNVFLFTGPDVLDVSDIAMSQHYVECQTCGCYSEFYCNACHQRMCGKCRNEHLRHPDNTQHDVCKYEDRKFMFSSVPCKVHPKHQMVLCCKKCQQAICALCTIKEHDGHGFLDLEDVYTKKYKTRTEEIRRIRDEFLSDSRLRLQESRNATLELKGNLELMRNSMKEQAILIKGLVDAILTENLLDLYSYESSAVEKLENQEKVIETYVTHVQDTCMLEEYKNSMVFGNPVEFLSGINDTLDVKFEPIPEVQKLSPGNFSQGKLNKEEIRKQFGILTKQTNET